jgi:hypothetical protein
LSDGTRCGSSENWDEYFSMGGAPLHQALDRAMSVVKLATDQGEKFLVSRDSLLQALKVPHHGISVTAMDLLTTGPMSSSELNEILAVSHKIKGRAKKLYFKMLAQTMTGNESSEDRRAYVKSVFSALQDTSDKWTQNSVISGLDKYGLTSSEFSQAIRLSCKSAVDKSGEDMRHRMVQNLESKARRQGYHLPVKAICLNSSQPAFVDR